MLLKDMTQHELNAHLRKQLAFIKSCQTLDTIGSMLVIFQDDGIAQYGATIDPETEPESRELCVSWWKREDGTWGYCAEDSSKRSKHPYAIANAIVTLTEGVFE